jgi:3'-phosphoadenosine 5'-phosphosulfate sulfotransferase (PAPS reductase)/FAD synthetase
MDYENEKILKGLSGGINSMALLCWLVESGQKPKEVHLFYAHFLEHSDDTFKFVADGIRYARKHFSDVRVKITKNSIISYFESENIIPHPASSPCSKKLKIEPINIYAFENEIKIDLVGYVKHELKRRANRQQKNMNRDLFALDKVYPIGEFTDEWCFDMVKKHIGWYPAIYDIKNERGQRVFKHNNCLPCKNYNTDEMKDVEKYFPEKHLKAMELSRKLTKYWGRDENSFYATFGRDLGQESTCGACKF